MDKEQDGNVLQQKKSSLEKINLLKRLHHQYQLTSLQHKFPEEKREQKLLLQHALM